MASPFVDNNIGTSLAFESVRLKTFYEPREDGMCGRVKLWSSAADITPEELAKDGFFFLKKADHCGCIFCGGIIGMWEKGDTVRGEHKRHFPCCPFIIGNPVGNIPMPLCEHLEPMWRETVVKQLKIRNISLTGVMYSDFSTFENREASFTSSSWSMDMKNKLLAAGFYKLKTTSDHVRCFRCGLGLMNWSDSMDPLKMHAKYSPDCMVVKLLTGTSAAKTHHDRKTKEVDDKLVDLVIEHGDIERAVVKMGFPSDTVKAAVKKRLLDLGTKFYGVIECTEEVLIIIEEKERMRAETTATVMRSEDRKMGAMDVVGTKRNSSSGSPEYFETLSDEGRNEALTMLQLPHQHQEEQQEKNRADEPSQGNDPATFTRTMDLHNISISEGQDLDMGAEEISGEGGNETSTELNKEEEGSPSAQKTEERKARVEELEKNEEPKIQNNSKSDDIMQYLACKVCLCEEAIVVLFPCKHLCMCPKCAICIWKCPICRANIVDVLKITRC